MASPILAPGLTDGVCVRGGLGVIYQAQILGSSCLHSRKSNTIVLSLSSSPYLVRSEKMILT